MFASADIKDYFEDVAEEYVLMFMEERLDYEDRMYFTDVQLQTVGVSLMGHRVKLLRLFADRGHIQLIHVILVKEIYLSDI